MDPIGTAAAHRSTATPIVPSFHPGIGSISPAQVPAVATAPEVSAAARDLAAALGEAPVLQVLWRVNAGDFSAGGHNNIVDIS